jgi:hypothetical protein
MARHNYRQVRRSNHVAEASGSFLVRGRPPAAGVAQPAPGRPPLVSLLG